MNSTRDLDRISSVQDLPQYRAVIGHLRSMGAVQEDAEDAVQQAILELLENSSIAFEADGFWKVVKTRAVWRFFDFIRADRVTALEPIADMDEEDQIDYLTWHSDQDDRQITNDPDLMYESSAFIQELLANLTPRDRKVGQAILAGGSREEIAAQLGLTRDAIDQIWSRAKKRMKQALAKGELPPRSRLR
ncbi:MAG: sigma-70 family RNA polymerase sigma factor [Anaerolineales bacterium]|nr:sigma-70 family RNA polymerase sigma factor [Anaerolineales bacterium]